MMWTRTFSKLYSDVDAKAVWRLWQDINNWPKWHDDLEYCELKGKFAVGNYFILKPKGVKPVKIKITDIKPGKEFTDCTQFPGAKMYDTHTIQQTEKGVLLTNSLRVTGPLRWLWIKLVAKNVADTVPHEMEALVELARQ